MKILVFIVAYNAEKTIKHVLDRIPKQLFQEHDTSILIIDDFSSDNTFNKGLEYNLLDRENQRLKVLKNPENQGYGGNQKLGYHYAIKEGYDVVALLHGDGQYAPENLMDLIQPLALGDADAVFGSRMMVHNGALKGGMPLYKYIGNRILTWYENLLLKASLSEYHSGYRVYSVKALSQVPFEYNTNDFHFDTEIIIQFLTAGFKIKERPIPTYYGDEICYVNGMKYAFDVATTVLVSKFQRWGLLYDKKYDCPGRKIDNRRYNLKLDYASSHTMSIKHISAGSSVLDVGCGPGYIGGYLARHKRCRVLGIDKEPVDPVSGMENYIVHDLNSLPLPVDACDYDYILLLDIVEHLKSPEDFMAHIRKTSMDCSAPIVLISVPNVAFFVVRLMLLLGYFNYGKRGILDMTHTRLFTIKSICHLLEQNGFQVLTLQGVPAPVPLGTGNNVLGRILVKLNQAFIGISKSFFSYQILVSAKPLPTIDCLLEKTLEYSAACTGDLKKRT